MKDINSALRSHRKPAKPELYQLIVVVNFNRVISYRRLIENRFIVNIPNPEPLRNARPTVTTVCGANPITTG